MKRYYYKTKEGNGLLSVLAPLDSKEIADYVEISEKEFNEFSKKEEPTKNQIEQSRELSELLAWFEYYDVQVSEYNRSVRLGTEWDGDIEALDAEAVTKAARIRKLRG